MKLEFDTRTRPDGCRDFDNPVNLQGQREKGCQPTAGLLYSDDQVRDFGEEKSVCSYEDVLLIPLIIAIGLFYSAQL